VKKVSCNALFPQRLLDGVANIGASAFCGRNVEPWFKQLMSALSSGRLVALFESSLAACDGNIETCHALLLPWSLVGIPCLYTIVGMERWRPSCPQSGRGFPFQESRCNTHGVRSHGMTNIVVLGSNCHIPALIFTTMCLAQG
jgi:hypothetical protein